jgi:hypothetical protein
MKRTIIIETNGHKDNYVEWDFVLMRPVSEKVYEQRMLDRDGPRDQNIWYGYGYNYPQSTLVDRWNDMYWDKYLLGRIQYVTDTYKWKRRICVDFTYFTSTWNWWTYKPFGYWYSYFDGLRVDIIKCFDYMKYNNRWEYIDWINKLLTSKERAGIPTTKIVYCRWSNMRRADMSNGWENNIISRLEYKRREREVRKDTATPEEVMERNVYPN